MRGRASLKRSCDVIHCTASGGDARRVRDGPAGPAALAEPCVETAGILPKQAANVGRCGASYTCLAYGSGPLWCTGRSTYSERGTCPRWTGRGWPTPSLRLAWPTQPTASPDTARSDRAPRRPPARRRVLRDMTLSEAVCGARCSAGSGCRRACGRGACAPIGTSGWSYWWTAALTSKA
jgi:hypothetical protein